MSAPSSLVVYGHAISVMTWQVLFVLAEKGLSADQVSIDIFAREQRADQHRDRHPFGHIPVLRDDALILYETHAILRYLDDAYPDPPLTPDSAAERGVQSQWLCVLQNYLEKGAKDYTARDRARMLGDPDPGAAVVEAGRARLCATLGIFADHLAERSWVAGRRFGLADLTWATFLDDLTRLAPAVMQGDRRIDRWLEQVRARSAWAASMASRKNFGIPRKEQSHD